MNLFYSIILGIVQGLTEFLPISSSAHLALLEQALGIQEKLQFTVLLHFGSLIALLVVMRKELKEIIVSIFCKHEFNLCLCLIIGSIPAGIAGLLFNKKVELAFETPTVIAVCLIITGIILWLTRSIGSKKPKPITLLRALIIGIAQSIAILPGISRSGITIATGIYLGIERRESAKFSFLLAIIAILGASILELSPKTLSLRSHLLQYPLFSILGFIASFVTSYFAIKLLLRVVKTQFFALFSLYCWVLGSIILAIG